MLVTDAGAVEEDRQKNFCNTCIPIFTDSFVINWERRLHKSNVNPCERASERASE